MRKKEPEILPILPYDIYTNQFSLLAADIAQFLSPVILPLSSHAAGELCCS